MGEAAGARGRRSWAGKGVQPPAAQAPQAGGAKRTHRRAALSTRRGGEWWLVALGPHPGKHLSSLRDPGVSAILRRRPVAAPAFVPGGKPARRARVGLRGEKNRKKGKSGAGEEPRPELLASAPGKLALRPSVPLGAVGVGPTRRANSHASGHGRDFHVGAPAPCDPSRRVTSRGSPLPRHPASPPREQAARPPSGF